MDWLSSHFSIANSSSFMVHISWHPSISQNSGKKNRRFQSFFQFLWSPFRGNKTQKCHMLTSKCFPSKRSCETLLPWSSDCRRNSLTSRFRRTTVLSRTTKIRGEHMTKMWKCSWIEKLAKTERVIGLDHNFTLLTCSVNHVLYSHFVTDRSDPRVHLPPQLL